MRIVYNPQSTLKLATITAQTGSEVIIEHHGTRSVYKNVFTSENYESFIVVPYLVKLYVLKCTRTIPLFLSSRKKTSKRELPNLPQFGLTWCPAKCTLFLPRRLSGEYRELDEQ